MKKNKIRIFEFFILAVIGLVIAGCANAQITPENNNKNNNINFKTISTGSTQTNDVLIGLTPIRIENNRLEINFAANTHSVDLSQFDLMKITALIYDNKQIKLISAPALSGHHSSGELVFNIDKTPNNFKITIINIPNIEERIFEWP